MKSLERGMKGHELVNEVVMGWESVVNRVAKGLSALALQFCPHYARVFAKLDRSQS